MVSVLVSGMGYMEVFFYWEFVCLPMQPIADRPVFC